MKVTHSREGLGRNLTYGLLALLGRRIVTGGYDGRPFLTEAQLAKEYDVSRSVTREAVKMLTVKGLLAARPRQGTIVLPHTSWNLFDADVLEWTLQGRVSVDLLRHFMDLRAAIEPAAAELAAVNADTASHEAISCGYRGILTGEGEGEDALAAEVAFHTAILIASGNPFFMHFRHVVGGVLRSTYQYKGIGDGHARHMSVRKAVFDAILHRKALRAHHAMGALIALSRAHIDRSRRPRAKSRGASLATEPTV